MTNSQPTEQELESALSSAENANRLHSLEKGDAEFSDAPFDSFFNKEGKVIPYPVAMYLIEKRYAKTVSGVKRELYVYKDGIYVFGDDILKKDIRVLTKSASTNHHVREIMELIKDLTVVDRETFTVKVNFINLNNGVYDLLTGELLSHDPQYYFFTKVPIDFVPDAQCPTIKRYLSDVLDEDQTRVVLEWFGYALYREYFIKKALILVGEGDTGKTTLINLLYAFIGEKNVSGVSLQKLTYERFSASALEHKHLNVYDDLSAKDIQDNGVFKIATGGGVISGEKKFKDHYMFKNYAKHTFACNTIPDVKNATDDAYFLRWIVITFNKIIEDDKKDKQLIHKMTTPEELSGLLNLALEGLRQLLKDQKFSYEKETHEIKTEMMRSASSIARFAGDCLEEATGEWISKEDTYFAYASFCSENKIPATSTKTFGSRLPMCAPYIAEFKPKDPKGAKQVTAWRNVRLKRRATETEIETLDELSQLFSEDQNHG